MTLLACCLGGCSSAGAGASNVASFGLADSTRNEYLPVPLATAEPVEEAAVEYAIETVENTALGAVSESAEAVDFAAAVGSGGSIDFRGILDSGGVLYSRSITDSGGAADSRSIIDSRSTTRSLDPDALGRTTALPNTANSDYFSVLKSRAENDYFTLLREQNEREAMIALHGKELPSAPQPTSVLFDVPCYMQYPELPTGCESVALTNLLRHYGFSLEKTTIADEWLPKSGSDFVYSFLGNPRSSASFACMAPCIVNTANEFLLAHESQLTAVDITDATFDEVLSVVGSGYPVIIWVTIDLIPSGSPIASQMANGKTYSIYSYNHCIVVSGYDLNRGVVAVSDSLVGQIEYDIDVFSARYRELGSQAVYLEKGNA